MSSPESNLIILCHNLSQNEFIFTATGVKSLDSSLPNYKAGLSTSCFTVCITVNGNIM